MNNSDRSNISQSDIKLCVFFFDLRINITSNNNKLANEPH